MSKIIKLTEEQIVAIENYLREDGNTIRGAAREVLGKESRESTIRSGLASGLILGEGFEAEEVLVPDQLVEMLRLHEQDNTSFKTLAQMFGISRPAVKRFFNKKTYKEFWETHDEKGIAAGETKDPTHKRKVLKGSRYVITSAQNNTFVHDKFLKSLLVYCEENDAELLVSTFHYNKNGFQNGNDKEVWFDPKIREYIIDDSCLIGSDLVFCGELNILPTAVNPLSGLHNYTNEMSAIIPHAKLQVESLATGQDVHAKILYTTGSVTQRNYVQMKAGQKAEHHHCFSALSVELDEDGDWFVRQLNAESDTGEFYDLDRKFTPKGCFFDNCVEAINWGDIHAAKLNKMVAITSWGDSPKSIVNTLKPKKLLAHDTMDMCYKNHHGIGDPYFLFQMYSHKTESVEDEINLTVDVLKDMAGKCEELVVIESNHDLAIERYLKEQDYRKDPLNAIFFLKMQLNNYQKMFRKERLQTFKDACDIVTEGNMPDNIKFLTTDESYRVVDIECGSHGDRGSNGTRGSVNSFQKQGIKYNIGHGHSFCVKDGVWMAGACMSAEESGYAKGASSWSFTHVITYKNGKRTGITIKEGKWKA